MPRVLAILPCALILISGAGCKKSPPANAAATVNDRHITWADLDKQFEAQLAGQGERPAGDQAMILKLELLRSLIDGEIMLQRAEKLGLMAVDADVEAKFNELKAPFTQEELQRQLASRKLTAEDWKAQLRRDLSIQKLINKEITSKISISDKDVTDYYQANRASFNRPEPQIRLARIRVTPVPDPNVRNLQKDKAQNEEQARRKVQMLEGKLRKGEDFALLAMNYSEDPDTAPNGGDMGFLPESWLEDTPAEIRKAVLGLQPGQMSTIASRQGYLIVKMISREPAGQRTIEDPRVQQEIRETLINRKDQLLKAAYYEVARNEAKVVNNLAAQVAQLPKK